MSKPCPKCNTEMVDQSYIEPSTGTPLKQDQCFKCGYSEEVVESTAE